nr:integrase, catalytic region, zinc finger, CCHC-type, peptidase aspartic, catalytic [Tanacetum cinerariifolium]
MYDGELIHSNKLVIHSTDSEETLEDAEESRNKMRHNMVQIDYEKLNALYETFVPQQEVSAEQTYFSISSTSDNGSKSIDVSSETPGSTMTIESRKSSVKSALFTSLIPAKSMSLGATSIVAKSRFSVVKIPTATNKVIQLVLWIFDSGYSKHTTGNLQLLRNFIEKFIGTVRFGNDHFAIITGYGDYVQGNLTICHVYYVEGLGYNTLCFRVIYDVNKATIYF